MAERSAAEVIAEVTELCKERVATARATPVESDRYYLVSPKGTMVIWRTDEGVFMLAASRAEVGFTWSSFAAAKRAADRWNLALNAKQRAAGCLVHACGHAQYLEYIVVNGEQLLATIQARGNVQ